MLTGRECSAVEWRPANVANRDDRTTLPLKRHRVVFVSRYEVARGCGRSLGSLGERTVVPASRLLRYFSSQTPRRKRLQRVATDISALKADTISDQLQAVGTALTLSLPATTVGLGRSAEWLLGIEEMINHVCLSVN